MLMSATRAPLAATMVGDRTRRQPRCREVAAPDRSGHVLGEAARVSDAGQLCYQSVRPWPESAATPGLGGSHHQTTALMPHEKASRLWSKSPAAWATAAKQRSFGVRGNGSPGDLASLARVAPSE